MGADGGECLVCFLSRAQLRLGTAASQGHGGWWILALLLLGTSCLWPELSYWWRNWRKRSFREKLKFVGECSSVNDLWPFPPHPLHCCGLVFWEWKMPEGGRRKGCAAYPFSPTSYNLLNFLCINRFSFPGISRHLFSSCGRHYVHWISFWNNETVLYIRD